MIIDETKEFNYRNVKFFKLSKTPSELKLLTSVIANENDVKWISYLDEFIFFSETQSGIKSFKLADPIHNKDLFLLAENEIERIEKSNEDINKFIFCISKVKIEIITIFQP